MRVVFLLVIKFYMSQKVHTSLEEKNPTPSRTYIKKSYVYNETKPPNFYLWKAEYFFPLTKVFWIFFFYAILLFSLSTELEKTFRKKL